jgi:proteic killer suppression protein
MVIVSFSDTRTESCFVEGKPHSKAGWRSAADVAKRKLDMLHYAHMLSDLASPPGNRLEALHGSRKGWHSVRINDQWRIVFRWTQNGPADVSICDYH